MLIDSIVINPNNKNIVYAIIKEGRPNIKA